MASLNEIRAAFVAYFRRHGHAEIASGPLVPFNDPTLLFTNSGMVQFKDVFTGRQRRAAPSAVTVQKCVRAGGKHNDLDNVGYTARHHTFFEMMGNFSFGDFFKERAIPLAWELVVKEFDLPKERLLFTVYAEDEEAAELWKKVSGFGEDRIIRIPTADNFWSMGPVGPCGPCSEIFFDHGERIPGGPPGSPDEEGDRFVEIWNLVFMQYEQFADGTRQPLARPSIDTGMGLERIGAVLQGTHDNYETDLFRRLIEASARHSGIEADGPARMHHRVIADHLRAASFLIAEGVLPSNIGRGYVLRRILRRAMRHARQMGAREPLLWQLVSTLVQEMGQAFPELETARALAEETLKREETQFLTLLDRGLGLLEAELARLGPDEAFPGEAAFRLFDTYGFPPDLTGDTLREQGRVLDFEGFEAAMAEQRSRSRAARQDGEADGESAALWIGLAGALPPSEFLGWTMDMAQGEVLALIREGKRIDRAQAGDRVLAVVNQTPFYAEAGGQVGDTGRMTFVDGEAEVLDTRLRGGLIVHDLRIGKGALTPGDPVTMEIDRARRAQVRANHSATHLLHEALREQLGEHVAQRGSRVAPDRLRFDFSQPEAPDSATVAKVEIRVNEMIRQNSPVSTRVMATDEAIGMGARALFGEKYGEEVRVVSMGEAEGDGRAWSVELCGGTHVVRTGDIGVFKILREQAIAAGVRRIEAVTGQTALERLALQDRRVMELSASLQTAPEALTERVDALRKENRDLQRALAELRRKQAGEGQAARMVHGVPYLSRQVEGVAARDLRGIVDDCRQALPSGVIAVAADLDGKAGIAVGVSPDLVERLSAVTLVRVAAAELGGSGGGGRADLAQAGGPHVARLAAALAAVEQGIGESERSATSPEGLPPASPRRNREKPRS